MKGFRKYIVAAFAALALLLGGERKASAQVVVSSPLELAQMVLGQIQDYNIAMGDFIEGAGTAMAANQQYEEIKEKLENLKMAYSYAKGVVKGVEDLKVIIDVAQDFTDKLKHINDLKQILADYDAAAYVAAMGLGKDFVKVYESLVKDTQNVTRTLMTMQRTDPLAFLEQVRKLAVDFSMNYNAMVYSYMNRASRIYYSAQRVKERRDISTFLTYTIY